MLQRMVVRAVWHWQGLLLWLVRHPELRRLPMPWPSVETSEEYQRQPGARPVTATIISNLIELRNKMGFEEAFLENEMVTQALMIAKSKTGLLGRVKSKARTEAKLQVKPKAPLGATYNVGVAQLIGPRGGLPKSKDDLARLAKAYGINPEGKTVEQLKQLIRPLVESGARLYEETSAPAAASGSGPTADSSASAPAAASLPPRDVSEAVMTALARIYGSAPPDLLRAVTREAMQHLETRNSTLQARLGAYIEEDDEMGWNVPGRGLRS